MARAPPTRPRVAAPDETGGAERDVAAVRAALPARARRIIITLEREARAERRRFQRKARARRRVESFSQRGVFSSQFCALGLEVLARQGC